MEKQVLVDIIQHACPLSFHQYYILYNYGIPPSYKDALLVHQKEKSHQNQGLCAETYFTFHFFLNAYISFLQYICLIFFLLRKATKSSMHVF